MMQSRWMIRRTMVRSALALAALGLASGLAGCSPDDAQEQTQSPQREMNPETQQLLDEFPPVSVAQNPVDLGDVVVDQPVRKTVDLTNIGDKPVRITDAASNCGCTTPDVTDVVIAPGAVFALPVDFDAEGRIGNRSATVTLRFEDYPRGITFRVIANVLPN